MIKNKVLNVCEEKFRYSRVKDSIFVLDVSVFNTNNLNRNGYVDIQVTRTLRYLSRKYTLLCFGVAVHHNERVSNEFIQESSNENLNRNTS